MTNYNPLVSIVIPCFNNQDTVTETLNSLTSQTYSNIEIIIVDDFSTDNSIIVVQNFINNNLNLNIYHLKNEENLGIACTKNIGASFAKGAYFFTLDADDKISKTFIEECLDVFRNNHEIQIVYCDGEYFEDKTGKWILPNLKLPDFLISNCIPAFALIKMKTFLEVEKFDNSLRILEDWELWIKIISKYGLNCVYKISKVMFYYRKRRNKSSLMDNKHKDAGAEISTLYIYNKHYNFYSSYGLDVFSLLRSKTANEYYKTKYYNQWFKRFFHFIKSKK